MAFILSWIYSSIAWARLIPSYVAVPLPNSSNKIKLLHDVPVPVSNDVEKYSKLNRESTVSVVGKVNKRTDDMINKDITSFYSNKLRERLEPFCEEVAVMIEERGIEVVRNDFCITIASYDEVLIWIKNTINLNLIWLKQI